MQPEIRDPEIREPVVTTSALVPARPPRFGRVAGWLQRVTGLVPRREPSEPAPDWNPRLVVLEKTVAAHREETLKRLEQSEGRVLHHVQQQFEALESELEKTMRETVAREVEAATGSLRRWLVGAILLALVACGAAGLALATTFSGGAS